MAVVEEVDVYQPDTQRLKAPNWGDKNSVQSFVDAIRATTARGTATAIERTEKYITHQRLADTFKAGVEKYINRCNGVHPPRTVSKTRGMANQLRTLYGTFSPAMLKAQAKVFELNPAMYEESELIEALVTEAINRSKESAG